MFYSIRVSLTFNSLIPFFLFFRGIIHFFITAGLRKSFWCDSKNVALCYACYKFRWILLGGYRPVKVVLKNSLGRFECIV